MKTALQEIFEYWDTQNNPLVILNWIASNEKRLLEKEKEQIIELPSDEDIDKYIEKTFYGVKKHYFKAGVEFMRELILKQNK